MLENERRKRLLQTMKEFNKTNKNEILSFGNESEDKEVISTGIKNLDSFIGEGTKRGTFTVIYGGQSVGKSTLVLQTIANAQKQNLICCYVDLEHTFEKKRAVDLGINLEELILAEKCETAEQALEIIRKLCKEKVVDLVVVDSIQAMSPLNERENKGKERELASKEIAELARTLSKFFRVVSPDVFNAKASVIMIGQIRISGIGSFYTHADLSGGEALKHWAYSRLFIRRGQRSDSPVQKFKTYMISDDGKLCYSTVSEDVGFDVVIKLEKTKSSKSSKEGSELHLPFLYNKGFVDNYDSNADVQIRIDPEAPEPEQEKIKEMMIEKGILKDICEKIAQKYESRDLNQTLESEKIIKMKNQIEEEATVKDIKENCEIINKVVSEPKKKKRRGRPKKNEI